MSAEGHKDRAHEAIVEQASGWFWRHRSGELSNLEKNEFLEWLRASKLNLQEYLEQVRLHQTLARALPELYLDRAQLLKKTQEEPSSKVFALNTATGAEAPRAARKMRWIAAAAAAMLLAFCAIWFWSALILPQRITVPRGEQRFVQLADGSTMHVNVNSQIQVRYSTRERVIELNKGQAFFEVAPDPRRPFRVEVGGAEVVAVGTQFDVYRRSDNRVVVTVLQGKVDVFDALWAPKKTGAIESAARVRLTAGQQLKVGSAAMAPSPYPADGSAVTAWTRREVIFNGESLVEVADEINRYAAVPVYIEDPDLARMRVRAVFNPYDSDSFLAFIKQYGVDVETGPAGIHVRRAKSRVSEPAR